jgi:EAL domain-containing protein (putative c-di-GMP-specific phosphodiesterase class I)
MFFNDKIKGIMKRVKENIVSLQNVGVLYIENDEKIIENTLGLLRGSLKINNIYIARDSKEAIDIYTNEKNQISLIISNLKIAERLLENGKNFLHFLRFEEKNIELPIILISASHQDIFEDLYKYKISKLMHKPFDMYDFIEEILNNLSYYKIYNSYIDEEVPSCFNLKKLQMDFGLNVSENEMIKNKKNKKINFLVDITNFHGIQETLSYNGIKELLNIFSKQLSLRFVNFKRYRIDRDNFLLSIDYNDMICKDKDEVFLRLEELSCFDNDDDNEFKYFQETTFYKELDFFIKLFDSKEEDPMKINNVSYVIKPKILVLPTSQENVLKNINTVLRFLNKNHKAKGKRIKVISNNILDGLNESMSKETEMFDKINKAVDSEDFIYFYQPIIDNQTKEIVKYESLIRMKDNGKVLSPIEFLDISKKYKLYHKIQKQGLEKAILFIRENKKQISFNVSYMELDKENVEYIHFILSGVESEIRKYISFEILEDEEISDISKVKYFIEKMHEINVEVGLDDFGVAFSNLNLLIDLDLDFVKYDRKLIENIAKNQKDQTLIKSLTIFMKAHNIKTIAEFVENEEIYNIIKEIGVNLSQGYYFSKPLAQKDIEGFSLVN